MNQIKFIIHCKSISISVSIMYLVVEYWAESRVVGVDFGVHTYLYFCVFCILYLSTLVAMVGPKVLD